MKTITLRCRAFANDIIRTHRIAVDADGTVRVLDAVAGHYTTCHSLSRAAIRKARKLVATAKDSPITDVRVYRAGGEWYYSAWIGRECDHTDEIDVLSGASEDEVVAELRSHFPAARIVRVADVV